MAKKKLLLLGISGLTGYKLGLGSSKTFDVFGTYNSRESVLDGVESFKFDICNSDMGDMIAKIKPDLVINATALHNVDYCQTNPDDAYAVNATFLDSLNTKSRDFGFKIIHISTDYVFDGSKNKPYSEDDLPNPLSVYGQSKLKGERILLESDHAVIRTSVIYGWTPLELAGKTSSSGKPINFGMWLLTKLSKGEPLSIVTDQFASATLADSLAESILTLAQSDSSGLYHVAGLSCESRYDFSIKLAKEFGYDPSLISKTDSSKFLQKAKRPNYSCLDSTKFRNNFGEKLLSTEESLKIMREQVSQDAPYLLGPNR